jgi:CRP/FNR family transcriptional regulator
VHLVKSTPRGGPATLFAMTPSEPICGISAFDHGTYAASAVAATDCQLVTVSADLFASLLDRHPSFARRVLLICCERIRRMAEAISLAQATAEQRIAYVLLRLQRSFGDTIPVTHHELAAMAGTRWETSIRTLSTMRRSGWVASSRGRITLLAPRKLRTLLNGPPVPSANGHVGVN